eukprot:1971124-Heterocapsa_arctica.AAC.1
MARKGRREWRRRTAAGRRRGSASPKRPTKVSRKGEEVEDLRERGKRGRNSPPSPEAGKKQRGIQQKE